MLITSIRCGVLHIGPGRPNPSFHSLVLHPFLGPLLWCVQGIGSLRFPLCFLLLSMKKTLQIPEVCSPFRGPAHPLQVCYTSPKPRAPLLAKKSISNPAVAADKRRTAEKLSYNAVDTFGTKRENLIPIICLLRVGCSFDLIDLFI